VGALPEHAVRQFVEALIPSEEEQTVASLIDRGDEVSLRQALELDPDNEAAVVSLAELLVGRGEHEEALSVLARLPETAEVRRVAAAARLGGEAPAADDYDVKLEGLLDRVRDDEQARQEFIDLLELMGPDDPRTAGYRKQLTSRLF
jgi:putative thioredoxin